MTSTNVNQSRAITEVVVSTYPVTTYVCVLTGSLGSHVTGQVCLCVSVCVCISVFVCVCVCMLACVHALGVYV